MDDNFKLIRGARILQALVEDSTPQELERNIVIGFPKTKKRQHVTQSVVISKVTYIPNLTGKKLIVKATATNNGNKYEPSIVFDGVVFEPTDTPTNTTFVAFNNDEYNITPISLKANTVKVRCTCLDFYHRFAVWNFNDDSLYGAKPPPYQRKTDRPPVNPMRVPGLCKHLIRFIRTLKTVRVVI